MKGTVVEKKKKTLSNDVTELLRGVNLISRLRSQNYSCVFTLL